MQFHLTDCLSHEVIRKCSLKQSVSIIAEKRAAIKDSPRGLCLLKDFYRKNIDSLGMRCECHLRVNKCVIKTLPEK